jgi:hypothetical protein
VGICLGICLENQGGELNPEQCNESRSPKFGVLREDFYCLLVCLFVCLFVCFVCLFMCLFVCLNVFEWI